MNTEIYICTYQRSLNIGIGRLDEGLILAGRRQLPGCRPACKNFPVKSYLARILAAGSTLAECPDYQSTVEF